MSTDNVVLEDPSSSHRVYIGDSIGCLRVAQCDPPSSLPKDFAGPSIRPLILPNFKSHSDHAVQRIATGVLGSDTYVVALARKNATIDVIQIINQSLPSTSTAPAPSSELQANILCTVYETQMKAGIHRFIGLAVSTQGIYTITSSGIFRFTPISVTSAGTETNATLGEATVIDILPSPLQHAHFYPPTDPTHFCYGGEDVPLSLWHIPTSLSDQPPEGDMSVESAKTDDLAGLNSKQRKRKRQLEAKTKARELVWGEVWRAKNLPNDNLSLPRRANITATCILALTEEADGLGESSVIAVGTKDGLVRIFQPGGPSRRHVREMRVVPAGQGAVKTLCASSSALDSTRGGLLFAGDTGSKLSAVDWQTGAVVYAYKGAGQVGATLSMTVLPDDKSEALVTVSSDSLVRLHSTVPAGLAVPKPGMSAEKGEAMWSKMMASSTTQSVHAMPTAVVWDGVVPPGLKGVKDGEEEEEDEVWANMQEVSGRDGRGAKVNGPADGVAEDDDDHDEEEDEESEPEAAKGNGSNGKAKRKGGKPAQPKKSRK
ncbi:WD40/YVTN repeat-like-containing domain protein [Kalmanozyma brasiliensis GHG001]|uniref:Ribosome biogenesis protein NSA1 n=1 Tax=Kalmanozyma brasiliensis (strain GHG001) TaxID=1365824 RepID=V5GHV0_KALBG|nr:WD40/YVTN repeat-like-containing domain protein [Kalmanozyma brasiliensis GHG001]EST05532.1 WD40/YVTN repeat-like-containing domain protein [Kalmanozyma brasiliensis GHG001]